MSRVEHIAIEKDDALRAALDHAAALNEPGTSESELLRYLALVGLENLPSRMWSLRLSSCSKRSMVGCAYPGASTKSRGVATRAASSDEGSLRR